MYCIAVAIVRSGLRLISFPDLSLKFNAYFFKSFSRSLGKKISINNNIKINKIKSFIFVSSGYANSKSSGDYLRYKGLVEEELISLKFDNLGILRPSFLLGNRKEKE